MSLQSFGFLMFVCDIAGLVADGTGRRYGDWRLVATGCNALVINKRYDHTKNNFIFRFPRMVLENHTKYLTALATRGRGYPLVVHYWADLQSVHGLRCYGNITRTLVTSLRPSRDMTT